MLSRPLIAVLAIALGLPFLILFAIVFATTGVSASLFTNVLTGTVISVFLVLTISEIKRLADQP